MNLRTFPMDCEGLLAVWEQVTHKNFDFLGQI